MLRGIIRRAIRHGYRLGQRKPFFHKLVDALADEMGEAYPELVARQPQVEKALLAEEEQFAKTLDHGMHILEEALDDIASYGRNGLGTPVFWACTNGNYPIRFDSLVAALEIEGGAAREVSVLDRQRAGVGEVTCSDT